MISLYNAPQSRANGPRSDFDASKGSKWLASNQNALYRILGSRYSLSGVEN